MAARMPVLRQHHMARIARASRLITGTTSSPRGTARRAAGAEIVLHVDHQQHIALADGETVGHATPSLLAIRSSTAAASRLSAAATSTG